MFYKHTQTIAEATKVLDSLKEKLQSRKKKVIISIGTTDLRNDKLFSQMKMEFSKLFLLCQDLNLKPLITTIHCFDTPELKAKADMFNEFLLDNFKNVVDMRDVIRYGLGNVITSLYKK